MIQPVFNFVFNTSPPSVSLKEQSIKNKICNTDCLSLLKSLKTSSIDLIATDPPYEINFEKLNWDKKQLDWNTISIEFERVLKETGNLILFQGWSEVVNTMQYFNKHFQLKNWIIYDRIKGRGTKTNLVSTREDILWYVKNDKHYTYNKISSTIKKKTGGTIGRKNGNEFRALSNVWTDISPIVPWSSERVKHPTQKPLSLMERIVTIYSNVGDTVLDPFMGSGTTLVASKKLNRNYIGADNSKDFYELTMKRLNNAK